MTEDADGIDGIDANADAGAETGTDPERKRRRRRSRRGRRSQEDGSTVNAEGVEGADDEQADAPAGVADIETLAQPAEPETVAAPWQSAWPPTSPPPRSRPPPPSLPRRKLPRRPRPNPWLQPPTPPRKRSSPCKRN